jgi:hypothetical protein
MWIVGASVRPDLSDRPLPYTPEQVAEAVKARDVHFDPEHTPTFYVDTHVAPKSESPIFTALVKQGDLPPLAERMPKDPVVMASANTAERGCVSRPIPPPTWTRLPFA